jgi:hypothetical protein
MPKKYQKIFIEHFVVEAWGVEEEFLNDEKILLLKTTESTRG